MFHLLHRRPGTATSRRDWRAALCAAGVGLLLALAHGGVAAEEAPEYAVKAAFLYNFAKFAEWPERAFVDTDAPLGFCALGAAPFGTALDALEGKPVRARPLVVRALDGVEEAAGCHVLFVGRGGAEGISRVLDAVRGEPVLTVGESDGFCRAGGVINFVTRDGKVRFEINPDAAHRAGIRLSAQLLRLARVVRDGEAPR